MVSRLDMIFMVFCLVLVHSCFAEEKILQVIPGCPATSAGIPHPVVRADVPAEVTARCKNGDKLFTSTNGVKHVLSATLAQAYIGEDCQYYKKKGVNTYHVNVAIAWSERGKEVYTMKESHTITCVYDRHGNATSSRERMASAFLNPSEKQHLIGGEHVTANFSLAVIDVLGHELREDHLHIGRLVRLRAFETTGTVRSFRALSCTASNNHNSYAILRAGCGDGLVFEKAEGFQTTGNVVYSPYFDAFKLHGSEKVHFECNFTVCEDTCDGDSCTYVVSRSKRSLGDTDSSVELEPSDPRPSSEAIVASPVGDSPGSKPSSSSQSSLATPSTETKTFSVSTEGCTPTMSIGSAHTSISTQSTSTISTERNSQVESSEGASASLEPTQMKGDPVASTHLRDINTKLRLPSHLPDKAPVLPSPKGTNRSAPTSKDNKPENTEGLAGCGSQTSVYIDIEMLIVIFCVFGFLLFLSFAMSLYLCCKYELAQIRVSLRK